MMIPWNLRKIFAMVRTDKQPGCQLLQHAGPSPAGGLKKTKKKARKVISVKKNCIGYEFKYRIGYWGRNYGSWGTTAEVCFGMAPLFGVTFHPGYVNPPGALRVDGIFGNESMGFVPNPGRFHSFTVRVRRSGMHSIECGPYRRKFVKPVVFVDDMPPSLCFATAEDRRPLQPGREISTNKYGLHKIVLDSIRSFTSDEDVDPCTNVPLSDKEATSAFFKIYDAPYAQHRYSSVWNGDQVGHKHGSGGLLSEQAWSARRNAPGEWALISLSKPRSVRGVIVRPRGGGQHVQYVTWVRVEIKGPKRSGFYSAGEFTLRGATVGSETAEFCFFKETHVVSAVRLHVLSWKSHISLRFGLLMQLDAKDDAVAVWERPTHVQTALLRADAVQRQTQQLSGWAESRNRIVLSPCASKEGFFKPVLCECKDGDDAKVRLVSIAHNPCVVLVSTGTGSAGGKQKALGSSSGPHSGFVLHAHSTVDDAVRERSTSKNSIISLLPDGTSVIAPWPSDMKLSNLALAELSGSVWFRAGLMRHERKSLAGVAVMMTKMRNRVKIQLRNLVLSTQEHRHRKGPVQQLQSHESSASGAILATLPNPGFIPQLKRVSSVDAIEHWSTPRTESKALAPEYREAFDSICLRPHWVSHTKTMTILRFIGSAFIDSSQVEQTLVDTDYFTEICVALISKAYRIEGFKPKRAPTTEEVDTETEQKLRSIALAQKDVMTGRGIFGTLLNLFSWLGWRKPYFAFALHYWVYLDTPDSLVAKLGEVIDRAVRCASAKRLAFDTVLRHAHTLATTKTGSKDRSVSPARAATESKDSKEMSFDKAQAMLHDIMEEYVDQHKLYAYKSAIEEPCRAYFNAVRNTSQRDHFNVHGLNWYLAGVMSSIGMQLPLVPFLSDWCLMGFATYWHAKGSDRMWAEFNKTENFGRPFEAIPAIARMRSQDMGRAEVNRFQGSHPGSPKMFANSLVAHGQGSAARRKIWARYVDRLCYFFGRKFFCYKALCVLMQENADNSRFLGFRACMEVVFQEYKARKKKRDGVIIAETNVLEYLYDDEISAYDCDRFNNLLFFVKVTKREVKVRDRAPQSAGTTTVLVKPAAQTLDKVAGQFVDGSKALLVEVVRLLRSGKSQAQVFSSIKASGLMGKGGAGAIFKAVRFAAKHGLAYT